MIKLVTITINGQSAQVELLVEEDEEVDNETLKGEALYAAIVAGQMTVEITDLTKEELH